MKNWRNAEIVELNINETAQGGKVMHGLVSQVVETQADLKLM